MDSRDAPMGDPQPDPQVATWVRDILAAGVERPAGADTGTLTNGSRLGGVEPSAVVPVPPVPQSGEGLGGGDLFTTDPARLGTQPPEPLVAAYDDRTETTPRFEEENSSHQTPQGIRNLIEWIAVLGGAFIVALVIKTFLLQAFFIPTASKESTLLKNDRILVNKLSYRLHDINPGDIVVFERPPSEPVSDIKDLIKRVVAVAGDTVEARNGSLFLNGQLVIEPYLDEGVITTDFGPITVPSDHLFVMGDNRGDSRDSRSFGPIDEELVIGRAFVRVWPYDRIGLL